jgi:hypothetical protein
MTGDPESKKEQDTFTPDTPKIYVEAELADTKDGDTVKGVFICDSSKISPPNYKIDELTQHLKAGMREAQFSCTKPTTKEGWPEGSYHVDLYVNDKLVKTLKYTVAAGG